MKFFNFYVKHILKIKIKFKPMAKKILFALTLVGGGITIIALILVVNYYVLFWTEPTTSPPGGFTPHPAGK